MKQEPRELIDCVMVVATYDVDTAVVDKTYKAGNKFLFSAKPFS